ncbi:TrkH family potassium uptake protein [Pseudaestuariivita atlantica]|uniref:Trk system potassium uptake protein n=1 Tax=Pseudaestuariivita atlantica TaxID=1317121 RepID=A0A0L1JUY8_9RHOB|nr:TrkH family potassium uptake protein [Pseudaestuariivita atlantica]KNG95565.1 potassium transporter TrkH [Pseudaestuariivita atlantica]
MFDMRPVGYVIGLLVTVLGATMLLPMVVDLAEGRGHWPVFAESAIITVVCGLTLSLSCSNSISGGLSLQQTFLLTTGVWAALPFFGAIPFALGATEADFVDAYFEAMSGLTTTGATVFTGLDDLPKGLLLWRGILQWLGGIGIIVVAMVFLPELRVGGMQIFRSEGFDTFGKILPRATEISARISTIYLTLTLACALAYLASGMTAFDATVHAMTTLSTGGFGNSDKSFGAFPGAVEYVAVFFMLASALPYVRFVQITAGSARPLFEDRQVQVFLALVAGITLLASFGYAMRFDTFSAEVFREALFNVTSIITGTGYSSTDYQLWGPFMIALIFFTGLIGGCAGSTSCSVKVFRYQLLFASIRAQVRRILAPHGVFTPKYNGRPVDEDVLNSVMAFFVLYFVTLGVISVALGMTGQDIVTSVSGAAAALSNIGPGLGDQIGPAGNFGMLGDTEKVILTIAMLIGRLELMAVFVLFTIRFWRA